jgi:TPR repeat protein
MPGGAQAPTLRSLRQIEWMSDFLAAAPRYDKLAADAHVDGGVRLNPNWDVEAKMAMTRNAGYLKRAAKHSGRGLETAGCQHRPICSPGCCASLIRAHAHSQYLLGFCYYTGMGVQRSEAQALQYYELAARRGHRDAQFALGTFYYNGRGVAEDKAQAVKWYKLAADQPESHAGAAQALGKCYDVGTGAAVDQAEAFRYFKIAADGGAKSGMIEVAKRLHNGAQGVEIDRTEALRYYKLAGIRPPQGHPAKHIAVVPVAQHIAGDPEGYDSMEDEYDSMEDEYDSMEDEYDSMEDSAHGGLSEDEDYDTQLRDDSLERYSGGAYRHGHSAEYLDSGSFVPDAICNRGGRPVARWENNDPTSWWS